MKTFLSLLLLCLACVALSPAATTPAAAQAVPVWVLCPQAPTDITVQNVTLALASRTLSLVMQSTVDEQVTTGAIVTVAVSLGGGQIFSENLDMSVGCALPVQGEFTWKYGVSIPSIAPSGAYQVDLTFSDQNGMPLTCLQVSFNLGG